MTSLRNYYLKFISKDSRYYKFNEYIEFGIIETVPIGNNVVVNFPDVEVNVNHIDEIIDIFKNYVEPSNDYSTLDNYEFLLVCFYLDHNFYYISQFPQYLTNPRPLENFAIDELRAYLIANSRDDEGTVRWKERRKLIRELEFLIKDSIKTEFNEDIEMTFKEISTRGSRFEAMSNQEKLKSISNYIERELKVNNQYIPVDENVMLNLISDEFIIDYRKKLHCYRHSTKEHLEERELNKKNELFLIYLGIAIIHGINTH